MTVKEAYTTRELARLLGFLTIRSVLLRAEREGWQFRPRKGRGGGKEWLVASMPLETQHAIQMAEGRLAIETEAAHNALLPALKEDGNLVPARDTRDLMDPKRANKASLKSNLLDLYLQWQSRYGATVKEKQNFIMAYQAGYWMDILLVVGPNVSWKTLEEWKLISREQGLRGLIDGRGMCNRGKSMLTEKHKAIIKGQILLPNAPQIGACMDNIEARCKAEGLAVPSEDTVRRFVKRYERTCFDAWTFFRRGEKAWNDDCCISIQRNWGLVEVGEVVIADGHDLNFETINPETGKPCRMTLVLFLDGRSTMPLGWEVMPSENVASIASAFRRACIRLGRIPRVVYIDNGKAFRARFFKGRHCKDFTQEAFLGKIRNTGSTVVTSGLYKDLGVETIHAWAYHGQSKPIERFFGTMHSLEVFTPSYTGRDIAHKPARLRRNEKFHQKLHEKMGGRPLTLEETFYVLSLWFDAYSRRPNRVRHLEGRTPLEVFEEGRGPGVDEKALVELMLQKEVRTISKDGIRLHNRQYWAPELSRRRHPVLVRWDWQLSMYTVLVYDTDGTFICEARDREHYRIACGIHPAARVLGTEEQQRDLREAIELRARQMKESSEDIRAARAGLLAEARERQDIGERIRSLPPAPEPEVRVRQLTARERADIEAAKAAGAQARAEMDAPAYEPSVYRRFLDEPARYKYLFEARYEQGCELVPEDAAFMASFEETPQFQRNFKPMYDNWLEMLARRNGQNVATA